MATLFAIVATKGTEKWSQFEKNSSPLSSRVANLTKSELCQAGVPSPLTGSVSSQVQSDPGDLTYGHIAQGKGVTVGVRTLSITKLSPSQGLTGLI